MRIALHYGERSYGNEYPNEEYSVSVTPPRHAKDTLDVLIKFPRSASGRGRNWENRGSVYSFSLRITPENARKIATAILWQLESGIGTPLELNFGAKTKGA